MSERAKRIFAWVLLVAVFLVYFGGGYYFGVIDRPRRHPAPADRRRVRRPDSRGELS